MINMNERKRKNKNMIYSIYMIYSVYALSPTLFMKKFYAMYKAMQHIEKKKLI